MPEQQTQASGSQESMERKLNLKDKLGVSMSNSVAISILLGAILVSASVFYNTRLILKKLDGGSQNAASAGANNPAPAGGNNAPSVQPAVSIPARDGAAVIGNPNAPVTLVEFSDFQCPYCQRFFQDTFSQIKSKYIDTGKAKLVYRNFPLPFHQNAEKAAEAGECANRQGKFEAYYNTLFSKGQSDGTGLAVADLKKYAAQLNLDTVKFNKCLDGGEAAAAINQDKAAAAQVGVNGTPNVFVNGKLVAVYANGEWQGGALPYETYEKYIEEALKGK
ncbi:MAG: DsbA family protein [Patescibacteria group bacterium]|nr:DsbA family protein [Patescibacteria group bacterium]